MKNPEIKVGNKVFILYSEHMKPEERVKLLRLHNLVTVEDLDIVNGEVMGFYSVEFPRYLFTMQNLNL